MDVGKEEGFSSEVFVAARALPFESSHLRVYHISYDINVQTSSTRSKNTHKTSAPSPAPALETTANSEHVKFHEDVTKVYEASLFTM